MRYRTLHLLSNSESISRLSKRLVGIVYAVYWCTQYTTEESLHFLPTFYLFHLLAISFIGGDIATESAGPIKSKSE